MSDENNFIPELEKQLKQFCMEMESSFEKIHHFLYKNSEHVNGEAISFVVKGVARVLIGFLLNMVAARTYGEGAEAISGAYGALLHAIFSEMTSVDVVKTITGYFEKTIH